MAGSLSDDAENKILAHSVGKEIWEPVGTVYIALYTTAPNENTDGVEVESLQGSIPTGYERFPASADKWQEPSGGSIKNAVPFIFGPAGVEWGDIQGVAVLPAATGGSPIWYGTFSSPRMVTAGEKLVFDTTAFILSLN
jgi:hypothetical protein